MLQCSVCRLRLLCSSQDVKDRLKGKSKQGETMYCMSVELIALEPEKTEEEERL